MPFVPASPTKLFTRRQSSGGMKKLKRSSSSRNSKRSKKDPDAASSNTAMSMTTLEAGSEDMGKYKPEVTELSEQQDIHTALADTTSEQRSDNPARQSVLWDHHDDVSESEYSIEESQPVVGRASSVKVGKPMIVQHKPTNQSRLQVKNMDSIEESYDQDKDGVPGSDRRPSAISQAASTIDPDSTPRQQNASLAYAVTHQVSPALPTGSTLHSVHPVIADTGTQPEIHESNEAHQVNELGQGINRAMTSPFPMPSKLSRRVSIRPSDLIIRNHDRDGPGSSTFRETIVTTPYPGRIPSTSDNSLGLDSEHKQDRVSKVREKTHLVNEKESKDKQRVAFLNSPGSRDRFPSPARLETLFLDINLARHPSMRTTIEVQITDRSTFDDEMLFNRIRAAYFEKLLGTVRYTLLFVRRLETVVVSAPANSDASDFNSIDFIKHLRNPGLGKKRKAWVIWLRNNNPQGASRLSVLSMPTVYPGPTRHVDNMNARSPRTQSRRSSRHERSATDQAQEKKHERSGSDASSFHFVYSPGIPRLPFAHIRTKSNPEPDSPAAATHGSPVRSFFWPSHLSSSLSTASKLASNSRDNDKEKDIITTVSFQHGYRAVVISLLVMLNVLAAITAGALWVVFGVPGTRPGSDGQYTIAYSHEYKFGQEIEKTSWRTDAGHRVLTGIVIGIAVLCFTCLVEGTVLWMSWLLL